MPENIAHDAGLLALGLGLGAAAAACALRPPPAPVAPADDDDAPSLALPAPLPCVEKLSAEQISRYSRQLLLPCFGTAAQCRLCSASALVIGAGGLGSPVIAYLAGAGIGRLGVIDDDAVDTSNLHRQVIHGYSAPGTNKAVSAGNAVAALNPGVEYIAYQTRLTAENAAELVKAYDVVIDASDNMLTRYLVNDACVLMGRPLVSGAAIGAEGYCTVYNHTSSGGPCYRCIYAKPPPAATVSSCSDNGVLGAVPGVIGCVQALEALKLLAGMPKATVLARRMCIYDALAGEFRNMKTRQRSPKCAVCGDAPTIRSIADSAAWCKERDLVPAEDQQCAVHETLPPLHEAQRLSCVELKSRLALAGAPAESSLLLDVREPVQFEICALPGAKNVPLKELKKPEKMSEVFAEAAGRPVYVVCRRGVDSVTATHSLLEYAAAQDDGKGGAMSNRKLYNIEGGLQEWHRQVDPSFPIY